MVTYIAHPAEQAPHLAAPGGMERFAAACGAVSYALVAVLLRLVVSRDFFVSAEAQVAGPTIPLSFHGSTFSLVLPAQLREEALSELAAKFATVPAPPTLVAYCVVYAEFLLPICLVLGFGTRIAALALLIVTALLQIYVAPDALWTAHVYWIAILLVLLTCGGGAISLDRLMRHLYQK
jgi:putative oxidoreductase